MTDPEMLLSIAAEIAADMGGPRGHVVAVIDCEDGYVEVQWSCGFMAQMSRKLYDATIGAKR